MKMLGLKVQFKRGWVPVYLLLVASLLFLNCEEKKEFDYWQYVDWPSQADGDGMDMGDAGPDGSMDMGTDMDTDMGTDMDTDTMDDMPTD